MTIDPSTTPSDPAWVRAVRRFQHWIDKETKAGRFVWFAIIALVVLLIAYGLGKTFGDLKSASFPSWPWFAGLSGELAALGLAAMISGAVLKVLFVEGFFKDAFLSIASEYEPKVKVFAETELARVVNSNSGLDRLSPAQRLNTWHALTQRIYLPDLQRQLLDRPNDPDLAAFQARLTSAIDASFSYHRREYNKSVDRTVTVDWDDAARTRIKLTEFALFTLVPFAPSGPTTWTRERTSEAGVGLADMEVRINAVTVNGSKRELPAAVKVNATTERVTLVLDEQKPDYRISTDETRIWTLDDDPSSTRVTILVADGFTVRIANNAPGLRVAFLEAGSDDLFVPEGVVTDATPALIEYGQRGHWTATRTLLPGQGYQLIFFREKAKS